MPLKLFIVGIEPPFSKISSGIVLAEFTVKLPGLVAAVDGCKLRLAGAGVVLFGSLTAKMAKNPVFLVWMRPGR